MMARRARTGTHWLSALAAMVSLALAIGALPQDFETRPAPVLEVGGASLPGNGLGRAAISPGTLISLL